MMITMHRSTHQFINNDALINALTDHNGALINTFIDDNNSATINTLI